MLTVTSYALATVAVLLVVAGLYFARDQRRHVPLMLAAFVLDTVTLVIVEFVTPRIEDRADPVSGLLDMEGNWTMRAVHALFATAAYVTWFVQIVTGRRIMRGQRPVLVFHRKAARFFLVTRFLAYVTMFMV